MGILTGGMWVNEDRRTFSLIRGFTKIFGETGWG